MAAITSTVAVCSPCAVVTRRPAVATQRVAALARPAFVGSALPQRSFAVAKQSRQQRVRATGRTPPPAVEDDTTIDVEGLVKDLQEKWDGVENKTSVAIYAGGAVVLLWFSSTIVSAVNSVPLLPKLLELVGLGYSAWFVYRYLLFKSSREELIADVEELKKKISGAVEDNTSQAKAPPRPYYPTNLPRGAPTMPSAGSQDPSSPYNSSNSPAQPPDQEQMSKPGHPGQAQKLSAEPVAEIKAAATNAVEAQEEMEPMDAQARAMAAEPQVRNKGLAVPGDAPPSPDKNAATANKPSDADTALLKTAGKGSLVSQWGSQLADKGPQGSDEETQVTGEGQRPGQAGGGSGGAKGGSDVNQGGSGV